MRVLLTTQPLGSHLRPIASVATELRAAGHEVAVAAPRTMAQQVTETYGLDWVEAGRDWTRDPGIGERLAEILTTGGNGAFVAAALRDYAAGPAAVQMAHDVAEIIRDRGPDVVLHDCTDLASNAAAHSLRVPVVSLDNGCAAHVREHLSELLHGPASKVLLGRYDRTAPLLTPAPTHLLLGDRLRATAYRHVNPVREGEELPAWLADIPTDVPLIYVSLGSLLTVAPGLMAMTDAWHVRIIEALRDIPCQAVVSIGNRATTLTLPFELPPNVRVVERVPQPLLLERVSLFVTHGGFSSIREAVAAACPMVFCPLTSDQPDNAHRCAEAGLGLTLEPDATAEEIRATILRVVAEEGFRDAAEKWQATAAALPSITTVLPRVLKETTGG